MRPGHMVGGADDGDDFVAVHAGELAERREDDVEFDHLPGRASVELGIDLRDPVLVELWIVGNQDCAGPGLVEAAWNIEEMDAFGDKIDVWNSVAGFTRLIGVGAIPAWRRLDEKGRRVLFVVYRPADFNRECVCVEG